MRFQRGFFALRHGTDDQVRALGMTLRASQIGCRQAKAVKTVEASAIRNHLSTAVCAVCRREMER